MLATEADYRELLFSFQEISCVSFSIFENQKMKKVKRGRWEGGGDVRGGVTFP